MFVELDVFIYIDICVCFLEIQLDVLIDLIMFEIGKVYIKIVLEYGVCLVVGIIGFLEVDLKEFMLLIEEKGIGVIIVLNFVFGVVLMMKFLKMVVNYFEDVEIIELYYDWKFDVLSGMVLKIVEMILEVC